MIRGFFKIGISVLAAAAAMALICQNVPTIDHINDMMKFFSTMVIAIIFWLIVIE